MSEEKSEYGQNPAAVGLQRVKIDLGDVKAEDVPVGSTASAKVRIRIETDDEVIEYETNVAGEPVPQG